MKAVVCAIIKDEQRFLREWIDYHLALGFAHIYLFEDYGSTSHKSIVNGLAHVTLGTVEDDTPVRNHHTSGTQASLYNWFLGKAKREHLADWVLYTDIDEFLKFEDGYSLQWLMNEFRDETGVWLSWRFYNANGHIKRPKGGVVESYTQEAKAGETSDTCVRVMIKSIVNVHKAQQTTIHYVINGVDVDHAHKMPLRKYRKAWVNHYFSKSWEDYVDRMCKRGNMSNNYRSFDNFFRCNHDMLPKKAELIASVRHLHTVSTMWISKDMKIISGGNLPKLKHLEELVNPKQQNERLVKANQI